MGRTEDMIFEHHFARMWPMRHDPTPVTEPFIRATGVKTVGDMMRASIRANIRGQRAERKTDNPN